MHVFALAAPSQCGWYRARYRGAIASRAPVIEYSCSAARAFPAICATVGTALKVSPPTSVPPAALRSGPFHQRRACECRRALAAVFRRQGGAVRRQVASPPYPADIESATACHPIGHEHEQPVLLEKLLSPPPRPGGANSGLTADQMFRWLT
jgi:hypothetical protein